MLLQTPVDLETRLEISGPTPIAEGTRVVVNRHRLDRNVWHSLGTVLTGEVVSPPTLLDDSSTDGEHLNVFPDEPYPRGSKYASPHPVWVPRFPVEVPHSSLGSVLVCYTVEPLDSSAA